MYGYTSTPREGNTTLDTVHDRSIPGVVVASPVTSLPSKCKKNVGPIIWASSVMVPGAASGTVRKGYIGHAGVAGLTRLSATIVSAALSSAPSTTLSTINSGELT